MAIDRDRIRAAIYATFETTRLTYDIPILREVWVDYAWEPAERQDLLLTPFEAVDPGPLAFRLKQDLGAMFGDAALGDANVAFNRAAVVCALAYDEMLAAALPLTAWWQGAGRAPPARDAFIALVGLLARSRDALARGTGDLAFLRTDGERKGGARAPAFPPEMLRLAAMAGFIGLRAAGEPDAVLEATLAALETGTPQDRGLAPAYLAFAHLAGAIAASWRKRDAARSVGAARPGGRAKARGPVARADAGAAAEPLVFRIQQNRRATLAIAESRQTIKADAAARVFEMPTRDIVWAVIDSGIDATHPAFAIEPARRRAGRRGAGPAIAPGRSRVRRTFDFTRLRDVLSGRQGRTGNTPPLPQEQREELEMRLASGRAIDWSLLQHFIEIPPERYRKPEPGNEHGTHVAGIIGANWPAAASGLDCDLVGICPDIGLIDLRVFRMENGQLAGDEFAIMAALQFVSYLNRAAVRTAVHGVNLSLAIEHDVQNYACGRTPVCEECERLVASGVVVVAAAGNMGHQAGPAGYGGGYADISIVDPGNAEGVITVGATHRREPHRYGVSFFSSRGPTGDGRAKPDLVAPGEKILAPVPGGDAKTMDGTSMAAPHVSGAAALLLARYRELIGHPGRVKQALMKSATDLGRERYFQGAGLVDVLRAMQSI